jgi:hypothetical protein
MKNIQTTKESLVRVETLFGQLKPYVMHKIDKGCLSNFLIDEIMDKEYDLDGVEWGDDNYIDYLKFKIKKYNENVVREYSDGLDCFETMGNVNKLNMNEHSPLINLTYNLWKLKCTLEELICVYDTREKEIDFDNHCDCEECKKKGEN